MDHVANELEKKVDADYLEKRISGVVELVGGK